MAEGCAPLGEPHPRKPAFERRRLPPQELPRLDWTVLPVREVRPAADAGERSAPLIMVGYAGTPSHVRAAAYAAGMAARQGAELVVHVFQPIAAYWPGAAALPLPEARRCGWPAWQNSGAHTRLSSDRAGRKERFGLTGLARGLMPLRVSGRRSPMTYRTLS